jgi:hypothetical protein
VSCARSCAGSSSERPVISSGGSILSCPNTVGATSASVPVGRQPDPAGGDDERDPVERVRGVGTLAGSEHVLGVSVVRGDYAHAAGLLHRLRRLHQPPMARRRREARSPRPRRSTRPTAQRRSRMPRTRVSGRAQRSGCHDCRGSAGRGRGQSHSSGATLRACKAVAHQGIADCVVRRTTYAVPDATRSCPFASAGASLTACDAPLIECSD